MCGLCSVFCFHRVKLWAWCWGGARRGVGTGLGIGVALGVGEGEGGFCTSNEPNVDPTASYTIVTRAALIVVRRRHEIRIAGINGWASRQQRVGERRAAVVLQRAEHRIGVDLIAGAIQITATVVTANAIAVRCDRTMIHDIWFEGPALSTVLPMTSMPAARRTCRYRHCAMLLKVLCVMSAFQML